MSLGRRYDIRSHPSILLKGETPGRYRKLTDEEIAQEWANTQINGNTMGRRNDIYAVDEDTPKQDGSASIKTTQSVNEGKKRREGKLWKPRKAKSLTGKEEHLVQGSKPELHRSGGSGEQSQDQEEESVGSTEGPSGSCSGPDEGSLQADASLDVDNISREGNDHYVVKIDFDPNKEDSVSDFDDDKVTPKDSLKITPKPEKIKKGKKRGKDKKKTKVKDTSEEQDQKQADEQQLDTHSMDGPRHCQSCTCHLTLEAHNLSLKRREEASDSSSPNPSPRDGALACQAGSDGTSTSSHYETCSAASSKTLTDKAKDSSSESDKSRPSSAKSSKSSSTSTGTPEKPKRSPKTPPSTPVNNDLDLEQTSKIRPFIPATSPPLCDETPFSASDKSCGSQVPLTDDCDSKEPEDEFKKVVPEVTQSFEAKRYFPRPKDTVASAVLAGGFPGMIFLETNSPVMLQDGSKFDIISGDGFLSSPDDVSRTCASRDDVHQDDIEDTSGDSSSELTTQIVSDCPEPAESDHFHPVTSTPDSQGKVGMAKPGGGFFITTVPVESSAPYHHELRPPAGFKECDIPDRREKENGELKLPHTDARVCGAVGKTDKSESSSSSSSDDEADKPIVSEPVKADPNTNLQIPQIHVHDDEVKLDIIHLPNDLEPAVPNGDATIYSFEPPFGQLSPSLPKRSQQEHIDGVLPSSITLESEENQTIPDPSSPYVGIVVIPNESSSGSEISPRDRPDTENLIIKNISADPTRSKKESRGTPTSTSESESSSVSSTNSGRKPKIEKPKRKNKTKTDKIKKDNSNIKKDNCIPRKDQPKSPSLTLPTKFSPNIQRSKNYEDLSDTKPKELAVERGKHQTPDKPPRVNVSGKPPDEGRNTSSRIPVKTNSQRKDTSEDHRIQDKPLTADDRARDQRVSDAGRSDTGAMPVKHVPIPVLDLSAQATPSGHSDIVYKMPGMSARQKELHSSDSDSSATSNDSKRKGNNSDHSHTENRSAFRNDTGLSPVKLISLHSPLNVSQSLAATSNPNLNGFDKLEASVSHTSPHIDMDHGIPSIVRHRGHFVVVAIDFGTTFSGYALSFIRDPESVHMMRNWEGGDPGVINQKTPTTILLTPEGEFDSFGFTARDRFHNLVPEEARNWLYFERFKMVLHHNPDLTRDTAIKASNGQTFPALKVFALALRFFKDHALQQLSDQSGITIINDDVRWVITVPAIWKAPAKQFMRQAAYEADLVSPDCPEQLLIALEPEAASIYCRKLRMYQLVPEYPERRPLQSPKYAVPEPLNDGMACRDISGDDSGPDLDLSPDQTLDGKIKGTRYMVVDCGGGTVDITVHELGEDSKLKELYKATGGPYGATAVDDEFVYLLCDIFGHEFITNYRYKYPVGWVNLMINFESRKRSASPFKNTSLNVSLPFTFIDYFKKQKGGHIDSVVKKYGDKEITWSTEGMLRLSPHAMRTMFVPVMERIKHAVGDVLNNRNARSKYMFGQIADVLDLKYLFLVGGFAESPILQHEIRKEFSGILKVLIPTGVSLAILKGAVLFGLDPTVVNMRRSRLTYGVGVLNRFDPSRHPTSKLVHRDGVDWCTDVFDVFVGVDQPVTLGDTVIRSYTPANTRQLISVIHIYSSENNEARFITDQGVRMCGTLRLDLSDLESSDLPNRREIQARMMFGDTEIKVTALDVSSGRCVRAGVDFLNK